MVSVLLTSWKGLGLLRQLPNPISGPRRAERELQVHRPQAVSEVARVVDSLGTRRLPNQPKYHQVYFCMIKPID